MDAAATSSSPEDIQKYKNMPLPSQLEKALNMSRSRFFGEVGAIYESATEIPITFIKVLMTKIQEQAKEIDELKAKLPGATTTATTTKKPNRAERRRSIKKQAKKSKPKSEISNSI